MIWAILSVTSMITKEEGIILSVDDYKENDALLKVVLKESGLFTFVLKGAKKLSGKNNKLTMPFLKAEFIYEKKEYKTIASLQKGSLIENYYRKEDLLKLSGLEVIADITLKIGDDYNLYEEVKQSFEAALEYPLPLVCALYMARVSKLLGFNPIIDGCVICSNPKVVAISNNDGGFLCERHAFNKPKSPVKSLRNFRLINKADFKDLKVLKEYDYDKNDFILEAEFFFYHADFKIKSYPFFKSLLNMF